MVAEIERKYLVKNDSWRKGASTGHLMSQTYLLSKKNCILRIRLVDQCRAFLGVKFRTSPLRREEFEYEIPYSDALEMRAHARATLEKTRYIVEHCGYRWEIDVYHGRFDGLVVAEVELRHEGDQPPPPSWLGTEITGNPTYSNRSIAASFSEHSMPLQHIRKPGDMTTPPSMGA